MLFRSSNPELDDDEIILSGTNRMRVYNYLSIAAVAGGVLNFIFQYSANHFYDLAPALFSSLFLVFWGIVLQIVQRMKISNTMKNNFNVILFFFAIPAVTVWSAQYFSVTVWAFPFILIIFSLVFTKRAVLISIAVSTFLTQIILWRLMPQTTVEIKAVDYIVRMGIFAIGFWIAFYVNKAYVHRLKESEEQVRHQRVISDISSDFVAVSRLNIDEKINSALNKIGRHFQVDRAHVSLFDSEYETIVCTHEWSNEGIVPRREPIQKLSVDLFPWWVKHILSDGMVHIPDVRDLPEEAGAEKRQLMGWQVQSLLSVPITGSGKTFGYLGLDAVKAQAKWCSVHISLLKMIAGMLGDALAKADGEKEINTMAFYDHLTQLPNRSLFRDRAAQAIQYAKRSGTMIAVMFLDLDSFKNVNDTVGHDGGDELLINVAHQLSQCLRTVDTISRFGGDEFLILINGIGQPQDVLTTADRIMSLFDKPFLLKEQEFFITASAGIAIYPMDGEDTEMLIKNADIAMYNAKEKGKNQYMLCSCEMKNEVQRKTKLTNSLYRAKDRGELVLYYQPQVSLQPKRIIGMETLIRWRHPEIGMISPGGFIPLAEHAGLIYPIGAWVLKNACAQNKVWQDMGLPLVRMAVNVSVHQLRNPNFVALIGDILEETGLNPKFLELEITESSAVNEEHYIIDVLNDLKKLGVSISIDDFGTKYSSLTRLKVLPIDRIKMDMQFVHGIEESDKDKAITKIIINIAQNLGIKVIAEGVETKKQLEFLTRRMCDEVQGFYYYRPMPVKEAEAVLKAAVF